MSRCIHSFHYLRDAFFDFPAMTESDLKDWPAKMAHFASQNPIKFVAIVSLVATGAVPAIAFLLYVAGTVVATLIAAVVLDLVLLAFGVCGLAVAMCFVGCITGGVVGVFSALYFAYKAMMKSLREAKGRLSPSTLVPSSNPSSQQPSESQTDEPFDKNKHSGMMGLSTGLTTFITGLLRLTGLNGVSSDSDTDTEEDTREEEEAEEEWHSDLCRTSLIILGLTFAVVVMSYTVLLATYIVVTVT